MYIWLIINHILPQEKSLASTSESKIDTEPQKRVNDDSFKAVWKRKVPKNRGNSDIFKSIWKREGIVLSPKNPNVKDLGSRVIPPPFFLISDGI